MKHVHEPPPRLHGMTLLHAYLLQVIDTAERDELLGRTDIRAFFAGVALYLAAENNIPLSPSVREVLDSDLRRARPAPRGPRPRKRQAGRGARPDLGPLPAALDAPAA